MVEKWRKGDGLVYGQKKKEKRRKREGGREKTGIRKRGKGKGERERNLRNQNNPEMLSKLDSFAPGALLVDKGGFATGAVALNWIARFGGWGCGGSVGDSTAALQLRYGRGKAGRNRGRWWKAQDGSVRLPWRGRPPGSRAPRLKILGELTG